MKAPRLRLIETPSGPHLQLVGGNNEIILDGEIRDTVRGALVTAKNLLNNPPTTLEHNHTVVYAVDTTTSPRQP